MGKSVFTEADVRDLAGSRSYERGLGYLDSVGHLRADGGRIVATVRGTERYRVVLHSTEPLRGECDCPYGEDGFFCKHCVAVALTLLRAPGGQSALRKEAEVRDTTLSDWLGSLSKEELLSLVQRQLAADDGFKETLVLRASTARGDTAAARSAIRAMVDPEDFTQYGYIGYQDAAGYAAQVSRAAEAVQELAESGRADAAAEAARDAISRVIAVYGSADDSDGEISQAAADLAEAHLAACAAGSPDPEETARWIVDRCLDEDGDCVEIEPAAYADILGPRGLAELRALGEEALSRNPSGWAERYLMETLVRVEGNVDELVALYAADLTPNGARHLRITMELDAAGRADEALTWAENGLRHAAAEQTPPHVDLVAYTAERYARQGRTADALTVRRDHFLLAPSLPAYRELRAAAQAHGVWDTERPRVLDPLREVTDTDRRGRYAHGSLLIDVLIDDGDLEEAWTAAPGRAHPGQLLTLADASVTSRPADALDVYLQAVASRTQQTGDHNYHAIADLLLKARTCHETLGTQAAFTAYATTLRAEQKRKRNLIRILDGRGL
ncbi:SWIM zinc finger domain-containing protein [Streptomyces sp. NPDC087850]|uniref:SWIM zinc finger family protein n=1 Tax=Streptomyces sp. NPDC087850 TaxID=3365809 RepID=UPI0038208077